MKTTINKFNKFLNEISEENNINCEKYFLQ